MPVSLHDAVEYLYRVTVEQGKAQSPSRLSVLAGFCVQELERRGLHDVETEVTVPGAGRAKQWDVAWQYDGKHRLGISLKSLLKNIPGTVPNRLDDLMGEVANAQLYSPEIVIGYVMLFDVSQDTYSTNHGCTWFELFQKRIASLSGRRPPSWTPGTIEAHALVEIDFAERCAVKSDPSVFDAFFDCRVAHVRHRNPNAIPG
ncbi:MAG: hypothetical protein OXU40_03580 [Nitrospira sp.]|nr:hypothetical protein [Nitrospira sp.]